MADTISDDFAIANGIAAYALARETLALLQAMGVPAAEVLALTMRAHKAVAGFATMKRHAALPIAADLLQDAVRQLEASSAASH